MYMNFKNGNILSLTVTNFQTFKKQKFTFGPALNLIAAPNGSGKSSIANSIAFLFNGTPKTIGKSKVITEFIRFENKEAEIEGEIFYMEKIYNLKRKITFHGSTYFINNSIVSKTDYHKFLDTLNINVNNLCNFLPQERVVEFCRMSPSELLEEFLKSTDVDMTRLKQLYEDMSSISNKLESIEKQKEIAQNNYNILKNNMEAFKERENNEEKLKKLSFIKVQMEYENLKKLYNNVKQEIMIINSRREEILNKEIEIKNEIKIKEENEEFQKYNSNCQILKSQNLKISEISNLIKKRNHENELLKLDMDNKNKKIEEKRIDLEKRKAELSLYKEKLEKSKIEKEQEINIFIKKVDSIYNNPELSEFLTQKNFNIPQNITRSDQLEQIIPSTRIFEEKIQNLEYQIAQMRVDSEKIQKEYEELQIQQKSYLEFGHQRMEMLKNYSKQTYEGVKWLRENKHMFKEEILEPCYLHINIKKEYSDIVETFLSYQGLTTFIVKNDEDFKKFTLEVKDKLDLGVNVATMSKFISERFSDEDLKYFNFDGVVSDFIECRQEYKDFLNSIGWLNCVPVSKNEIFYYEHGVKKPAYEEDVFKKFSSLKRITINGRYSEIKRNKYGIDFIINTNRISSKETFSFPKVDLNYINSQLSYLNNQREQNKIKMEKILETRIELQKKKNFIKNECNMEKVSKLIYFYNTNLSNISHIEQEISKFDVSSFENAIFKIKEEISKNENYLYKFINQLEDLLDFENLPNFDFEKFNDLKLDLENLNKSLILNNLQKEQDTSNLNFYESLKRNHKIKLEELKDKIKLMKSYDISELVDLPKVMMEIEAEISKIQTKLDLSSKNNQLLNDYKDKEKQLNDIEKYIDDINNNKNNIVKRYEEEKEKISAQIYNHLAPVNQVFKDLFRKFNFEGQISLDTSNEDWELKVLVKFRQNEELQKLSASRQSGGEKSLTTILFLLALQQCEEAPFRLVDEINQGMDSYNEKKVFEILKEMSNNSQFFIITPKLVDDLVFSENTNAIIVYGGPGITKDIENYVKSVLN